MSATDGSARTGGGATGGSARASIRPPVRPQPPLTLACLTRATTTSVAKGERERPRVAHSSAKHCDAPLVGGSKQQDQRAGSLCERKALVWRHTKTHSFGAMASSLARSKSRSWETTAASLAVPATSKYAAMASAVLRLEV